MQQDDGLDGVPAHLAGQFGSDEAAGNEGVIETRKLFFGEVAQAAAERVADQERPRQHGRADRDA